VFVDFSLIFCPRLFHQQYLFYATGSCEHEGRGRCHCLLQVSIAKNSTLVLNDGLSFNKMNASKSCSFQPKICFRPIRSLIKHRNFETIGFFLPINLFLQTASVYRRFAKLFPWKLFLPKTVPLVNCSFG
jgi:hypothetical protein